MEGERGVISWTINLKGGPAVGYLIALAVALGALLGGAAKLAVTGEYLGAALFVFAIVGVVAGHRVTITRETA